jgi:hypothetical protein
MVATRNAYRILVGISEGTDHWEEDMDWRIILNGS